MDELKSHDTQNISNSVLCSLLAIAYASYIAQYKGAEPALTESEFLQKYRDSELNFRSLFGI